ncbi:MAG: T9SS type A sorting domain-containing protein [Ferruginibacter sp.]|nr:T9SS type A sorting domain-containing protein [Ferruginibacter sp.]
MQSNITQKRIKSFSLSGLIVFLLSFLATMPGWAQPYVNGNLRTGTSNAAGTFTPGTGFFVSELQTGNTAIGSSASYNAGLSMADDFTIPAGQTWNISGMEFYGYSTGYTSTTPFYDTLFIKIYDANPSTGTPTPVWGDFLTNRLGVVVRDSTYRVTSQPPFDNRMIWRIKGNVTTTLSAGTYWIEWTVSSIASVPGHFMPPSTVTGTVTQAGNNALQHLNDGTTNQWAPFMDAGSGTPQDLPFKIYYNTSCTGPNPTVSINASSSCTPATLTASGADLYTWSPAGGLSATNGAVVTANPTTTTTYTVTGVTTGGCSGTATVTIEAGPTSAILTPLEPGVNHILEGFSSGVPATWVTNNRSNPPGAAPTWNQGNPNLWPAYNGAPQTYLLSNFNVAGDGPGEDTISNWVFTPQIATINNGDKLSFYTRTVPDPGDPSDVFPDNMEVRLSTAGGSVNVGSSAASVGDFSTLLLAINPSYDQTSYPHEWTKYEVTISGLSGPASGRIGFRHYVPDGGPNGNYSDNIGLDLVRFYTPTPCVSAGSPQFFHVNVVGGNAPFSFVYSDGTTNTTVSNYAKDSLIAVNPSSSTTYTLVSGSVTGSTCATTNVTGALSVTIGGTPTITTQPSASVLVCENGTGSISIVAPGNTYQWQVSTDGGATWTNVSDGANYNGAASASLSLSNVPASWNNYQYHVIVTSSCGGSPVTSTASTISVTAAAIITSQPTAQVVCSGSNAVFNIAVTGNATYQWQVSADGGATWSDITGETSNTLTITGATAAQNGYQYQVIVTGCSGSATSNTALLSVDASTVISTQPQSAIVCDGSTASFSVVASGAANTYQWQVSTDGGTTWTDITGATSANYNIAAVNSTMNNNQYQVAITNPCGAPVISTSASLTITVAATITTQPADVTVCSGAAATFSVTVTGATPYQWQVSTDGGTTWTDIPGETSNTLSFASVTNTQNGTQYRVNISSCSSPVSSTAATLTVNESTVISTQPQSAAVCDGSPASFSVVASGAANTYQWQVSTDGGTTWTDITGATSADYNIAAANSSMNNNQYQVAITNPCGAPVISNAATLTISAAAAITAQPADATVCEGTDASFSITASGATGYQWQVSNDGGTTWSDITGATTATYSLVNPAATANGNKYRVVVTGCGGATINSNEANLTVNPAATITTQPADATACSGADISFSVTATGTALTYQWQISTDGGATWSDITGTTTATYSLVNPAATEDGNKYRVVINGSCTTNLTSDAATLSVSEAPVISAQPQDAAICEDGTATFSVTASGAPSYQWQVSTDGGTTWTDITGATNASLSADEMDHSNATSLVQVVVTNSCGSVTSGSATLTVNPLPVSTISATSTTLAPGETATLTVTSTPAANAYQWYFNGNAITNATNDSYTVTSTETGVYTVQVTTAAGCSAMSAPITINAASISFAFITPNPNDGSFKVNFHNAGTFNANRVVTIYDARGRLVFKQPYVAVLSNTIEVINISVPYLHPGIYWLMLSEANGKRLEVGQFMKR